jgi:hypothetical protein
MRSQSRGRSLPGRENVRYLRKADPQHHGDFDFAAGSPAADNRPLEIALIPNFAFRARMREAPVLISSRLAADMGYGLAEMLCRMTS